MEQQRINDAGNGRQATRYGTVSMAHQGERFEKLLAHGDNRHRHRHDEPFGPEPKGVRASTRAARASLWKLRNRDRISRFLDHSAFGVGLDVGLAVASILYVAAYIVNTYLPVATLPLWLWVTELLCAGLFAADYVFRGIYLSDHRIDYMLSLSGVVTLVVILPVLPVSFFVPYHSLWYTDSYWLFVYPVRFVKCYLELRAVLSRCHNLLSPMRQFALLCYVQLALIVAGAAGIIQIAETSGDGDLGSATGDWTFFNAFFNSVLVFVTIQTPPADNALAKIFVGVLVVVLILIVPYQVTRVLDLGKAFTTYQRASFKPSRASKHIVLCGDLTPSRITHFFGEMFHDDHDLVDLNVVVLSEDAPSASMVALLMDPFFDKRARFLQGSILDVDDAQRAACSSADAIFVLSRFCGQADQLANDHRTLLRVMAAKRLAPNARILAQMHLSSNRHLMDDLDVKNVLYFSEVMSSLLAQNCVCPGFSTFIYNLTSTSSFNSRDTWADAPSYGDNDNDAWEQRYLHGASHEVYAIALPPATSIGGKTFSEVASLAYDTCAGVIVFAVAASASGTILLNPGDSYTCVGGETAFAIATDRREANAVTAIPAAMAMPTAWVSQQALQVERSKQQQQQQQQQTPPSLAAIADVLEITTHIVPTMSSSSASMTPTQLSPATRRRSKCVDWQLPLEPDVDAAATAPTVTATATNALPSVQDHVIENVTQLDGSLAPIVVCVLSPTAFPDHVEYFIGPLRVKSLQRHRPIVLVTAVLPPPGVFATFSHFSHVAFIQGSPFAIATLERAGVARAFKVVIMCGETRVSDAGPSELLTDAPCIALHKTIASLVGPARAPRIVTELVNSANVHFVSQNLRASRWFASFSAERERVLASSSSASFARNFFVSPAFASGLTYSSSLCDSLLINQYFSEQIKSILREFIFTAWKDQDYVTAPHTADHSSCAPVPPIGSPTTDSQTQASPLHVQRSSLFAVEVPLDFVGRTFAYVFHALLSSDGILAVGLYRCRPDATLLLPHCSKRARIEVPETERSMPFGYVYVNPFPTDVLTGNDLLYVLAHKQPRWAT